MFSCLYIFLEFLNMLIFVVALSVFQKNGLEFLSRILNFWNNSWPSQYWPERHCVDYNACYADVITGISFQNAHYADVITSVFMAATPVCCWRHNMRVIPTPTCWWRQHSRFHSILELRWRHNRRVLPTPACWWCHNVLFHLIRACWRPEHVHQLFHHSLSPFSSVSLASTTIFWLFLVLFLTSQKS